MDTNAVNNKLKEKLFYGNLGNWHKQISKLLELIYNLIDEGFEYDQILVRAQSWNTDQVVKFLPFYVHERVNYAWRKTQKMSGSKKKITHGKGGGRG